MGKRKQPRSSSSTTDDDEESSSSFSSKLKHRRVGQKTGCFKTKGNHVVSMAQTTSLMELVQAANSMKPGKHLVSETIESEADTVTVMGNTFIGVEAFQLQMASKVAADPKPTTSTSRDTAEAAGPAAPAPPDGGNRSPPGPRRTGRPVGSVGPAAPFLENSTSTSQGSVSGDRVASGTPSTSGTGEAANARPRVREEEPIHGAGAHPEARFVGGNVGTAGSSRPRIIAVAPTPVLPRPHQEETRRTGNDDSGGERLVPDIDHR